MLCSREWVRLRNYHTSSRAHPHPGRKPDGKPANGASLGTCCQIVSRNGDVALSDILDGFFRCVVAVLFHVPFEMGTPGKKEAWSATSCDGRGCPIWKMSCRTPGTSRAKIFLLLVPQADANPDVRLSPGGGSSRLPFRLRKHNQRKGNWRGPSIPQRSRGGRICVTPNRLLLQFSVPLNMSRWSMAPWRAAEKEVL